MAESNSMSTSRRKSKHSSRDRGAAGGRPVQPAVESQGKLSPAGERQGNRPECVSPQTEPAADRSANLRFLALLWGGVLLYWASQPPLDYWPLAWIAAAGWLLLVRMPTWQVRHPYRHIYLAGFAMWLGLVHWLRLPHWSVSVGWVALAVYLGMYLPVFIGLCRIAHHRLKVPIVIAAPVIWTGLELAQAHLLSGFTMGCLGYSQYRWTQLIQVADLTGFYGVSFVVICLTAGLAACLPLLQLGTPIFGSGPAPAQNTKVPGEGADASALRSKWRALFIPGGLSLAVSVSVLGGCLIYGKARLAEFRPAGPVLAKVGIIQGSIDSELKSDPDKQERVHEQYFGLSRKALEQQPDLDLLVWPETMLRMPLLLIDDDYRPRSPDDPPLGVAKETSKKSQRAISSVVRRVGGKPVAMLLGLETYRYHSQGNDWFNSALLVDESGRHLGRYDKMHPVVFGEFIPFGDWIPALYQFFPAGRGLTPGRAPVALSVGQLHMSPSICFETVLPHLMRRQVAGLRAQGTEPNLLVNLTNDGWFWGSSELDMHLACGVFRAVECRKPLVIAANTGLSAIITPAGHVISGKRRESDILIAEIRETPGKSLYSQWGDWFSGLCLLACAMTCGAEFYCRRVAQ